MHTLFWLRTDLRAHDNPALAAAARDGTVTALFLAAPGQWKLHGDAPAKVDFWLRNLHALSRDPQAWASPEAVDGERLARGAGCHRALLRGPRHRAGPRQRGVGPERTPPR